VRKSSLPCGSGSALPVFGTEKSGASIWLAPESVFELRVLMGGSRTDHSAGFDLATMKQ